MFQIAVITLLCVIIVLQLKKNNRAPSYNQKVRKVVLDSCALIDGRIIDLANSGFVPNKLVVPEFILKELQMLADGSDSYKRDRARYGLDVVKELQTSEDVQVSISRDLVSDKNKIDDKLLELCKKLGADLYTTDYNLEKLADIESVRVLNVNELAQKLRPTALPGESKSVKIVQKGSNPKQGVGYMDDGTMVVVDGAARSLGKTVQVEVTRIHQTVSGKMLFANKK